MFMHLRGGGIGHKATWDWREWLERDSGARTSRDGGAEPADSNDTTDSEGGGKADEELDEEDLEDGKGEGKGKDRDEEQQAWDAVVKTTMAMLRKMTMDRNPRKRRMRMMFTVLKAMAHSDLGYGHYIGIHKLAISGHQWYMLQKVF